MPQNPEKEEDSILFKISKIVEESEEAVMLAMIPRRRASWRDCVPVLGDGGRGFATCCLAKKRERTRIVKFKFSKN